MELNLCLREQSETQVVLKIVCFGFNQTVCGDSGRFGGSDGHNMVL